MTEAPDRSARAWERLIRRTRVRINCGWVADALAPLCLGTGLAGCALLLLLRSLDRLPAASHPACALGLAGALVVLPIAAYLLGRRRFVSAADACTRLEAHLGLHNALTAARQGLRSWPPLPSAGPSGAPDGLRWRWPHLAAPPLVAALLVGLPFVLPVPVAEPEPFPPNQPLAWETMDGWLDQLQQNEIADPADIERIRQQLEALRRTPPAEWFRDASLEATDALQSSLERSLETLENNLSRSAQAIAGLEKADGQLSAADRHALQQQLRQAIDGLANPELGLHPSALERLQGLRPSELSADPAAAQALRDALRRNAQSVQDLMGQADALREQWERKLQADALLGETAGDEPGSEPGQGAPTRGPGEAPLRYAEQPVDLNTEAPERLAGFDPGRAAAGDLLGTDAAKPTVKPGQTAAAPAGAIGSAGQGGQEVWESALLPSERAVLRRYFR